MGHQIYVSKTVNVGGTPIAVRQPIFKGQDGVPALVSGVLTEARGLLTSTLALCNPSGKQRDIAAGLVTGKISASLFQKLFLQPLTHQVLSTVWAKLALVHAGLNAPFGIKVYTQGDSSTNGYVNKYFPLSRLVSHQGSDGGSRDRMSIGHIQFGRCTRTETGEVLRDSRFKEALVGRGEIHVSFERLNSPLGAKTLIHEAAHKFANLADFSYMYNFRYNKTISPAQTLLNADSYAWLAFLGPSASAQSTRRQQNRSASADEGLEGLASLFG